MLKKALEREFPNQEEIDAKIEEIVEVEDRINLFMEESGFTELCKKCLHVCCAQFIFKLSYVAK